MQLTAHVHAVHIPFQVVTPTGARLDRFVYAYLVYGQKVCLIDTGVASSERLIFDYLAKSGRKAEDIALTVLTHAHPDHIGAAAAVQQASGCSFAAHPAEQAWIEDVERQARERPVPGFHTLVEGPVKVDRTLHEGDLLDLGDGVTLEVLHTPGHSKGSISLWLPKEQVLFTADAVPVPGDMPIYEDAVASAASIKKLKQFKKIKLLLAAWDAPRQGAQAGKALADGLDALQRIHQAVLEVAGGNPSATPMDLCRLVLERLGLPEGLANPLVAASFQAHLKARDRQNLLAD